MWTYFLAGFWTFGPNVWWRRRQRRGRSRLNLSGIGEKAIWRPRIRLLLLYSNLKERRKKTILWPPRELVLVLLSLGRLSLEPQKKGGENLTPPLSSLLSHRHKRNRQTAKHTCTQKVLWLASRVMGIALPPSLAWQIKRRAAMWHRIWMRWHTRKTGPREWWG